MSRRNRKKRKSTLPERVSSSILMDIGDGLYYIWSRAEPETRIGGFRLFSDAYSELVQLDNIVREQMEQDCAPGEIVLDVSGSPVDDAMDFTKECLRTSTPDAIRERIRMHTVEGMAEHCFHELYWLHSVDYTLMFDIGMLRWRGEIDGKYGVQAFIENGVDKETGLIKVVRVGIIKVLKTLEAADLEARHMTTALGRTRSEIDDGVIDIDDWVSFDSYDKLVEKVQRAGRSEEGGT